MTQETKEWTITVPMDKEGVYQITVESATKPKPEDFVDLRYRGNEVEAPDYWIADFENAEVEEE